MAKVGGPLPKAVQRCEVLINPRGARKFFSASWIGSRSTYICALHCAPPVGLVTSPDNPRIQPADTPATCMPCAVRHVHVFSNGWL